MLNLLIGIFFIIGGLSGKFVLIGTNSGELLALLGFVLALKGVYDLTKQRKGVGREDGPEMSSTRVDRARTRD